MESDFELPHVCLSVCLSVCMYQLGSHWTDSHKILYLSFIEVCWKIHILHYYIVQHNT